MAQKVVLITGTSTGIGEACVARQAEAGWKVYAGVRRAEDGDRLVASSSGVVVPVIIDVTKAEDIERVLAQIDAEVGVLHGLVNNAGIAVAGPAEMLTDEEWRWQFDVNFFSLVSLSRAAIPLMEKGDGRFVHIGSIAGRIATSAMGPYSASKHAVEAFNWSFRSELERNTKMSSSVVEPGEIKTAIWEKANETLAEFEEKLKQQNLADRYGHLLDGQRAFVEEGRTKGVEPDKVAQAVEHALTARRSKPRYLVGPDAQAIAVLGRLPDRLLVRLLRANAKRYEKAGRKLR
jgi:NAD(P)-dependent dehydrogenase (short-subunit alcohol dehydrogenase family)